MIKAKDLKEGGVYYCPKSDLVYLCEKIKYPFMHDLMVELSFTREYLLLDRYQVQMDRIKKCLDGINRSGKND